MSIDGHRRVIVGLHFTKSVEGQENGFPNLSFACIQRAFFLMSSVDAGLSPRIRQLIAQHRASLVSLRVQLELLPDIAAELQEYASEHDVCEQ